MIIRRVSKKGQEPDPVDARVPDIALWPRKGIAGRIARDEFAGQYVLAELFDSRDSYQLHLPEENLHDEDGAHILDDGVVGFIRPGLGGPIDYVTAKLDITWHWDEATVDRIDRVYFPSE